MTGSRGAVARFLTNHGERREPARTVARSMLLGMLEDPFMIRLKRAYEPAEPSDGYRVLVERLWPRGLRKADAHFDDWLKDVAPSADLRRWFGHDPIRFAEFRARYKRELHADPARTALAHLVTRAKRGTITLVYSAHDETHNNAVVLAQELERRLGRKRSKPTRHARASSMIARRHAVTGEVA